MSCVEIVWGRGGVCTIFSKRFLEPWYNGIENENVQYVECYVTIIKMRVVSTIKTTKNKEKHLRVDHI